MPRRRRKKSRRRFSLKKFFRDYPIVPVIGIVFVLGIWIGFSISQKTAPQWKENSNPLPAARAGKSAGAPQIPGRIEIPKPAISQTKSRIPAVPWGFPKAERPAVPLPKKEAPKLAFVIDDLGNHRQLDDLLFSIHRPLTVAILPKRPFSGFYAVEAKKRGFQTILHLPLEPEQPLADPGEGVITVRMNSSEVSRALFENLESVPGVSGVNNHMGSRATQNRPLMYLMAKEFRKRNLFFLDSLTHPNSQGYEMARMAGIRAFKRDVFIDNQDDFEYIKHQISEAARIAKLNGKAVAIGHIKDHTLRAIKDAIPEIEAEGIQLVYLGDVVS